MKGDYIVGKASAVSGLFSTTMPHGYIASTLLLTLLCKSFLVVAFSKINFRVIFHLKSPNRKCVALSGSGWLPPLPLGSILFRGLAGANPLPAWSTQTTDQRAKGRRIWIAVWSQFHFPISSTWDKIHWRILFMFGGISKRMRTRYRSMPMLSTRSAF